MMSDLVLNALRRNREIAAKAGQLERVERIDARLAELTGTRSGSPEAPLPVPVVSAEPPADLDLLRGEAAALGIDVDGRWGVNRLREEIDAVYGAGEDPKLEPKESD